MNGLLIYDAVGAERNKWFIDRLLDCAKKRGIGLKSVISDTGEIPDAAIDFAIVRTINPPLTKKLEGKGIKVFNNYKTSFVGNDKWQTYLFCKRLGIPVMPTQYGGDGLPPSEFPCVMKSCAGHGGREVFWADSALDYGKVKDFYIKSEKDYIVQRPCSELGKDMRIYVLGGEIIFSVLRFNPNGFKSNFTLGGKIKKVVPEDYQIAVVNKIVSELKSDYIGVDFIRNDGKWILNEIEDVVGSRMLYELADFDVAERLADHIARRV